MGWFNVVGLVIMILMMIPNVLYAVKQKDAFQNVWNNKLVEGMEQIGRYACFALMIFNIPYTYAGFWFPHAFFVYLAVNGGLLFSYCVVWAVFFRNNCLLRAVLLSVIPSVLFLFSAITLASVPLLAASLLFAPCHIAISVKNSLLSESERDFHARQFRPSF